MILAARQERVVAWVQRDARHWRRVAAVVPDVRVVMCGQVSYRVVNFCRRVEDALRVMCEARQVHAVLLGFQLLRVLALIAIVDLKRIVRPSYDRELSTVVEIKRCDVGFCMIGFEPLNKGKLVQVQHLA